MTDVFDALARGHAHAVDAVRVQHPNGTTYSINCVTWGMARDAAATSAGADLQAVRAFHHGAGGPSTDTQRASTSARGPRAAQSERADI